MQKKIVKSDVNNEYILKIFRMMEGLKKQEYIFGTPIETPKYGFGVPVYDHKASDGPHDKEIVPIISVYISESGFSDKRKVDRVDINFENDISSIISKLNLNNKPNFSREDAAKILKIIYSSRIIYGLASIREDISDFFHGNRGGHFLKYNKLGLIDHVAENPNHFDFVICTYDKQQQVRAEEFANALIPYIKGIVNPKIEIKLVSKAKKS